LGLLEVGLAIIEPLLGAPSEMVGFKVVEPILGALVEMVGLAAG